MAFGRESGLVDQTGQHIEFAHFQKTLGSMMEMDMAGVFVAEQNGDTLGMAIYSVFPNIFTNSIVLAEIAWYVDKRHRGGRAGIKLLRALEKEAERRNADVIEMMHLKNSMPERLAQFYTKRGYVETETHYLKTL